MNAQTITHARSSDKPPLHRECTMRALRSTLWVSVFLSQDLSLHALQHRITVMLVEVDRLLEELDLA